MFIVSFFNLFSFRLCLVIVDPGWSATTGPYDWWAGPFSSGAISGSAWAGGGSAKTDRSAIGPF